MSKEVITSAILVIVSVIAAVAFVNAILPSVYGLSESYSSVAQSMEDQFKTDIDIIFIYPEGNNVYVWIKILGPQTYPFHSFNTVTSSSCLLQDTGTRDSNRNQIPHGISRLKMGTEIPGTAARLLRHQ